MKRYSQRGFTYILFPVIILLISGGIIGLSFLIKEKYPNLITNWSPTSLTENKSISSSAAFVNTPTPAYALLKPEDTVIEFYQAALNNDKLKAKSLLTPDANKDLFKATFNEASNNISLYNQKFTFEIIESKQISGGEAVIVRSRIMLAGTEMEDLIQLKKSISGKWLINAAGPTLADSFFGQSENKTLIENRGFAVVTIYSSSAKAYLTDHRNKHAGVDPKTGKIVNEIEGTDYREGSEIGISDNGKFGSFRIADITGKWKLEILGTKDEDYKLFTRFSPTIIGKKTSFFDNWVNGQAKEGKIETFTISYPEEVNKSLKVLPVK